MRRSLFLVLALLLSSVSPAHAAEGGLLEVSTGLMFWTILIFALVFAILAKFAFPKILGAVEARERHLEELAVLAERDRAEAATLAEENRRVLEETRSRLQDALAESRVQGERLREEMLAEARREQEELIARARRDIVAEREVALQAVRTEAVEISIRAAEKLVRRNLDGDDNRRLVKEYLAQVGTASAGAGR